MDNFDLRKYLAEGRLLKEEKYTYMNDGVLDLDYDKIRAYISTKKGDDFADDFIDGYNDDFYENVVRFFDKIENPTDNEVLNFIDIEIKKEREEYIPADNAPGGKGLAEGKLLKEAFYPEFEGETNDKINDIAIAIVDELESKLDSESSGILKGMDYYVGSDGMDNDEVEQGFTKWFIDLVKYLGKNNNEVTISSVEQDGKVFTPAITLKYLDNGKEDISWKLKRDLAETVTSITGVGTSDDLYQIPKDIPESSKALKPYIGKYLRPEGYGQKAGKEAYVSSATEYAKSGGGFKLVKHGRLLNPEVPLAAFGKPLGKIEKAEDKNEKPAEYWDENNKKVRNPDFKMSLITYKLV